MPFPTDRAFNDADKVKAGLYRKTQKNKDLRKKVR